MAPVAWSSAKTVGGMQPFTHVLGAHAGLTQLSGLELPARDAPTTTLPPPTATVEFTAPCGSLVAHTRAPCRR